MQEMLEMKREKIIENQNRVDPRKGEENREKTTATHEFIKNNGLSILVTISMLLGGAYMAFNNQLIETSIDLKAIHKELDKGKVDRHKDNKNFSEFRKEKMEQFLKVNNEIKELEEEINSLLMRYGNDKKEIKGRIRRLELTVKQLNKK